MVMDLTKATNEEINEDRFGKIVVIMSFFAVINLENN